MFDVYFSNKAKKQFDNFENKYKEQIQECLKLLMTDPVPAKKYDLKKLSGIEDSFRIRIGKIRAVYNIDWKKKEIIIARIESRETVY